MNSDIDNKYSKMIKIIRENFLRKYILFFMLFLTIHSMYGQDKRIMPLNVSYFGESLIHPGIEISYENTFLKTFNFTIGIGTYIHQRNHVGLFVNAGINWRHTFPIGYSMEFGLGLGYLHTWEHGGDTYIADDSGNVSVKSKFGRPNFMPTVKLGLFGWDFRKRTGIPLRINSDIIIFGQYPFNNYMMPHVALKTGVTYYFPLTGDLEK